MRHYEILADGAAPYFIGLEKMPPNTMSLFPRQIVLALMSLPGVNVLWRERRKEYMSGQAVDVYEASVAFSVFPVRTYETLMRMLRRYVEQHLTTSAVAREVLAVTGNDHAKRVLIYRNLTVEQGERMDYMEVLAVFGMKFLFGIDAVEYPPLAVIVSTCGCACVGVFTLFAHVFDGLCRALTLRAHT
jgi:hypothetical protein